MFFRILKNDLKRKKTMNIILLLFIILATTFLASSATNMKKVLGAMDYSTKQTNCPDTFILSLGKKNGQAIKEYLESNKKVSKFKEYTYVSVENDKIILKNNKKYIASNPVILGTNEKEYMKPFDQENKDLVIAPGEIGIPSVEMENNHFKIGQKITLDIGGQKREFKIVKEVKDIVFGSSIVGMKRFFVNVNDYNDIIANTKEESKVTIFNVEHSDSDFVTKFKEQPLNVISILDKATVSKCYIMDMMTAAILLIVSVCLILIVFLILRFTIVFTLQEDYKEIGIMKAIGLSEKKIKSIYMIKYFFISVVGAFIGFFTSIPFGQMLMRQVGKNLILEDHSTLMVLLNVGSALLIVLCVLAFCYGCTRKLNSFSAITAIRGGATGQRYSTKHKLSLHKHKKQNSMIFMAVNDIRSNMKRFLVLFFIFTIGVILITLFVNSINTLDDDSIVELFHLKEGDLYLNGNEVMNYISKGDKEGLLDNLNEVEHLLEEKQIKSDAYAEVYYNIPAASTKDGKYVNQHVAQALGGKVHKYTMLEGSTPIEKNEVALSHITADKMNVQIGDSIYLQMNDQKQKFIVTGIYQTMNMLGEGIRISDVAEVPFGTISAIMSREISIEKGSVSKAKKVLQDQYKDSQIYDTKGFVSSMMGDVTKQFGSIKLMIVLVVILINIMIIVLMMKTLMASERNQIAIMKSVGLPDRSICLWQIMRIEFVLAAAIIVGVIFAKIIGPMTVAKIFNIMGAKQVAMVVRPLDVYLIYPGLLFVVITIVASICSTRIRVVHPQEVNNVE